MYIWARAWGPWIPPPSPPMVWSWMLRCPVALGVGQETAVWRFTGLKSLGRPKGSRTSIPFLTLTKLLTRKVLLLLLLLLLLMMFSVLLLLLLLLVPAVVVCCRRLLLLCFCSSSYYFCCLLLLLLLQLLHSLLLPMLDIAIAPAPLHSLPPVSNHRGGGGFAPLQFHSLPRPSYHRGGGGGVSHHRGGSVSKPRGGVITQPYHGGEGVPQPRRIYQSEGVVARTDYCRERVLKMRHNAE